MNVLGLVHTLLRVHSLLTLSPSLPLKELFCGRQWKLLPLLSFIFVGLLKRYARRENRNISPSRAHRLFGHWSFSQSAIVLGWPKTQFSVLFVSYN
eukprot:c29070_g6_i1 orf=85-372(-)